MKLSACSCAGCWQILPQMLPSPLCDRTVIFSGTGREPTGRDWETALGFLLMLNVFWDFKDTSELLEVTWLILLLWKKAQRVIDFKVSLLKLALQPAALFQLGRGSSMLPWLPSTVLLINQAQARYNDWRMTHEQSYQLFFFPFYFVEERWERYEKCNSSIWQYFPQDNRFTGKERLEIFKSLAWSFQNEQGC